MEKEAAELGTPRLSIAAIFAWRDGGMGGFPGRDARRPLRVLRPCPDAEACAAGDVGGALGPARRDEIGTGGGRLAEGETLSAASPCMIGVGWMRREGVGEEERRGWWVCDGICG